MTSPIHAQTSIGAVYLKVSDLARSAQFYQDVVGFKVLQMNEEKVELTANGFDALLVLEKIPNAVVLPRKNTTGLYHFAILVPTRKDLSLSVRNLIKHNLHVGQADHLVSEALYITDPENNGIEIYVDRPRSEWTYNANGEVKMAVDPIEWQGLLDEAGDAEWGGLAEGTVIGHIHLHVADLKATEQFYSGILGFTIMAHMANSALFLAAGGYHHHLGMNVWAGVGAPQPPENAAGLSYYEIVLPDMAALGDVESKLNQAGIPIEIREAGLFVLDPSKNAIIFTVKG